MDIIPRMEIWYRPNGLSGKSKMDAITTNGNVVLGNKVTMIINHYFEWEPAGFFPGNGEPAFVLEMQ